jgi:hypothetical protein
MERSIIHDQHRIRPTVVKELMNEVFKDVAVRDFLVDTGKDNTIQRICRKDVISLPAMKTSDLNGCHPPT